MISTVTAEGQITLPEDVRQHLHVSAGDRIEITLDADGRVFLRPVPRTASLRGIVPHTGKEPLTVEEMDEAMASAIAEHVENRR